MIESRWMRFVFAVMFAAGIESTLNRWTQLDPQWAMAIGLAFGVLAWTRYRVFSTDYQGSNATQGREG